jgi:hypothetical protein
MRVVGAVVGMVLVGVGVVALALALPWALACLQLSVTKVVGHA